MADMSQGAVGGGGAAGAIRRLNRELKEINQNPSKFWTAEPANDDLFEWHFTLKGPAGSDFEKGIYHGRIVLPLNYPFAPPAIYLLTPNGRFQTNKKICLSISNYHPELWQPAWGLRTMIEALRSFFPSPPDGALGALNYPSETRRRIAEKETRQWRCEVCEKTNEELLPLCDEVEEEPVVAASSSSSTSASSPEKKDEKVESKPAAEKDKETVNKAEGRDEEDNKKPEGEKPTSGIPADGSKKPAAPPAAATTATDQSTTGSSEEADEATKTSTSNAKTAASNLVHPKATPTAATTTAANTTGQNKAPEPDTDDEFVSPADDNRNSPYGVQSSPFGPSVFPDRKELKQAPTSSPKAALSAPSTTSGEVVPPNKSGGKEQPPAGSTAPPAPSASSAPAAATRSTTFTPGLPSSFAKSKPQESKAAASSAGAAPKGAAITSAPNYSSSSSSSQLGNKSNKPTPASSTTTTGAAPASTSTTPKATIKNPKVGISKSGPPPLSSKYIPPTAAELAKRHGVSEEKAAKVKMPTEEEIEEKLKEYRDFIKSQRDEQTAEEEKKKKQPVAAQRNILRELLPDKSPVLVLDGIILSVTCLFGYLAYHYVSNFPGGY
ncbi:unnamed protein product [Amoebophrya sp. A120]|nr:unnamed protein product [Amoebophrya sp. A120]|eukprot:GSA120T00011082001.1